MTQGTDWTFLQSAGVQTTLAVSALIALILLVRRPFARHFGAKAAYALWALPLLRLVMPPLPAHLTLFGTVAPAQDAAQPAAPAAEAELWTAPAAPVMRAPASEGPDLVLTPVAAPLPPTAEPAPVSDAAPAAVPMFDWGAVDWAPLLGLIWAVGAVATFLWAMRRQKTFHDLIAADSHEPSDDVLRLAADVQARLGVRRPVTVRESLLCSGPLVTGAANPIVLLPAWFETDYTPAEQRDALTHEMMHVRRRDLWALHAANLFLAAQWFNPLARYGFRAFRSDQEAACDADVLSLRASSPQSYGRTLLKTARLVQPSDRLYAAAGLTLAHPIKERLIQMQNPLPDFSRRVTGGALLATVGAVALMASATSLSTAQEVEEEPLALEEEREVAIEKTREKEKRFVFHSADHDDGRQMVILGDPFEDLQPSFEALGEIQFDDFDMEFDVEFDFGHLPEMEWSNMEFAFDFSSLGELAGLANLQALSGLSNMHALKLTDGDSVTITLDGEEYTLPGDEEAFEARVEEMAEGVEVRVEAWADAHEAKIEAWAEKFEAKMEAWADAQEARAEIWEAHAEKIAAQAEAHAAKIEAVIEKDFEPRVEAAAEVIESLAEQCEDRDDENLEPEIVSATNSRSGETFKALCLNGPRARLDSDEIEGYVLANPDLSEAERDAFFRRRDGSVFVHSDEDRSGPRRSEGRRRE